MIKIISNLVTFSLCAHACLKIFVFLDFRKGNSFRDIKVVIDYVSLS